MKTIPISSLLGCELDSRDRAVELREKLLHLEAPLRLDFQGVKVMTYSFAMEFFGDLAFRFGPSVFRTHYRIRNMAPSSRLIMGIAMEDGASQAAPARSRMTHS